jgi:hypothetical protein
MTLAEYLSDGYNSGFKVCFRLITYFIFYVATVVYSNEVLLL